MHPKTNTGQDRVRGVVIVTRETNAHGSPWLRIEGPANRYEDRFVPVGTVLPTIVHAAALEDEDALLQAFLAMGGTSLDLDCRPGVVSPTGPGLFPLDWHQWDWLRDRAFSRENAQGAKP